MCLIDGLAFTTESLAENFKEKVAKQGLFPLLELAEIIGLSVGLILAIAFVGFPQPLLTLLTNHQEIFPDG
ncbi:hypothetical protein [cyanobacterium endosymbiont of Rhopalodia gibberula]|uniref:hypothetical protein n=1 Tax=cyanobacterium endosymbiont of Rhopalodia gibberula TaxID=1763363 RepID=UPI001E3C6C8C|nr:hypothetical protein [cyanobacterium endosymbiont of Rhopalodia gibberula]